MTWGAKEEYEFVASKNEKRPICSKCYQATIPRLLERWEIMELFGCNCWMDWVGVEWKCDKCGIAFKILTKKSD